VPDRTIQDDRTPDQRATHCTLVVMTDRFLSGWGGASGGTSVAAWACTNDDADAVERWVRRRSDASRVRVVVDAPARAYRPRSFAHYHVYVVGPEHSARRG